MHFLLFIARRLHLFRFFAGLREGNLFVPDEIVYFEGHFLWGVMQPTRISAELVFKGI